jgi:hypothetical protein
MVLVSRVNKQCRTTTIIEEIFASLTLTVVDLEFAVFVYTLVNACILDRHKEDRVIHQATKDSFSLCFGCVQVQTQALTLAATAQEQE